MQYRYAVNFGTLSIIVGLSFRLSVRLPYFLHILLIKYALNSDTLSIIILYCKSEYLLTSTAVVRFKVKMHKKDIFSFTLAQQVLTYHVLYVVVIHFKITIQNV